MKKICIIQPLLAAYNLPMFEEIAVKADLCLIISKPDKSLGYGEHSLTKESNIKLKIVNTLKPFGDVFGMYQKGIISCIFKTKPDVVMMFANPRYLSFWTTLIFCYLFGIKVFPYGHGIFKKSKISLTTKVIYKLIFAMATRYLCYCDYVRDSFDRLNIETKKIAVVENSLVNEFPSSHKYLGEIKNSILFIGRIREGANLDLLIEAVEAVRARLEVDISLHTIGGGSLLSELELMAKDVPWIKLHGEVYDFRKINTIASLCDIGVYPGDAGLSVVHYLSLGLPVVVHDDYTNHLGPEPTYIKQGVNGFTFKRGNIKTLTDTLIKMYERPQRLKDMQTAAYSSYIELINPSQADRFLKVFETN